MNMIRVIPTLLLKGEGLVKTKKFKDPVYIGDPINAVRIFNEKEVDELVLLDITATQEKREPKYEWIKSIVSESFMPIGYGGGIKNVDQAKKLFDIGVEKIIINSAITDLNLISSLANIYGSQSIVTCLDVRKQFFGGYTLCTHSGTNKINGSIEEWVKKIINAGVGELIIQSIDREGTRQGYDIELIKKVSQSVKVPVVASGGAGNLEHLREAVFQGKASSVTAGSLFVFKGKHQAVLINYPTQQELKATFENQ